MTWTQFCENLNELLVNAFRPVLKLEEQMLRSMGTSTCPSVKCTCLEVVGKEVIRARTVSETAKELALTVPTVTVAANKLEKKGLLCKTRAMDDGRAVILTLSEVGRKIDRIHQRFHENMVKNIANGMDEAEKAALLHAMGKLNLFFDRKLSKS